MKKYKNTSVKLHVYPYYSSVDEHYIKAVCSTFIASKKNKVFCYIFALHAYVVEMMCNDTIILLKNIKNSTTSILHYIETFVFQEISFEVLPPN